MTKATMLLAATALALGAGACKKTPDSLLLLQLRASGTFVAPVTSVRVSVPDHADSWPTRVVDTDLGSEGFKLGYYVPGNAGPVTLRAEALDANACLLGDGTLTIPGTPAGEASPPMALFVRPLPASGCLGDGGTDATPPPGDGGGGDGLATDGSTDALAPDGASDAGNGDATGSGDAAAGDAAADGATNDGGVDLAPDSSSAGDASGSDTVNPNPDGGVDATTAG